LADYPFKGPVEHRRRFNLSIHHTQIVHIACHVFSFQKNLQGGVALTHLQLRDFKVGRRSMMEISVLFSLTWAAMLVQLIIIQFSVLIISKIVWLILTR
jgi:hypothetical protein